MHITFVYGRSGRLRPAARERAGGAIVSALLELAASLAERGHQVDVFSRCEEPGIHRGVRFRHRDELAAFGEVTEPDALVVVPDGLPLLFPIRTRARVLWTCNAFAGGDVALSPEWAWAPHLGRPGRRARLYPLSLFPTAIDRVIACSRWQRDHLSANLGLGDYKLGVIPLGMDVEAFRPQGWPRERHRIVYTSQVRRGLDLLMDLFPAIRSEVPQAELHVFSYDGTPELLPGAVPPGVVWRGRVPRSVLADELRSAGVMAYPSTFNETFCMAVAEAQAAGLPVVCSSRGALAERVTHGVDGLLVEGDPRGGDFGPDFVRAVVALLKNDALRVRMGRAATGAAAGYDWDGVAGQWESELAQAAAGNDPHLPRVSAPDLLDRSLLRVSERGHSAPVPAVLAETWLRTEWGSYGYRGAIPGLFEVADVSA